MKYSDEFKKLAKEVYPADVDLHAMLEHGKYDESIGKHLYEQAYGKTSMPEGWIPPRTGTTDEKQELYKKWHDLYTKDQNRVINKVKNKVAKFTIAGKTLIKQEYKPEVKKPMEAMKLLHENLHNDR